MYISVNGRIARKKQVEIFIFDVLEHLMPRLKRKVNIDVNIVTRCGNQHYALCLGDKNCAEIELARGSCDTKFSLDEIPQLYNVLKGEMSLIGPRPDYYIHALEYLKNVKGYRERHIIRPGITGLSQIRLGYAEGLEATAKKVSVDNYYIQNVNYIIELKIIGNTIITIIRGMGK